MTFDLHDVEIAIVGLGYVGLPLAVKFATKFNVVGYDIDASRISELKRGIDSTNEVATEDLLQASALRLTNQTADLKASNFYIVTVPTPVDEFNQPDFTALLCASRIVGDVLDPDNIVVYESTVYPGATETLCAEQLCSASGLLMASADPSPIDTEKYFYLGYSPERINPGDRQHRLEDIVKLTAGSTPQVADFINSVYATIITAGTYLVPSIKIAEAAKVIENVQRDVNIALINELSILFEKLELDTEQVLKAAGTKWNFLKFWPGLVGGHCIGIDPYYLTHKAMEVGHSPEIILAGRKVNDSMSEYVAQRIIKLIIKNKKMVAGSKVLIFGASFKENCPDTRNSKVITMVKALQSYGCDVDVYDPELQTPPIIDDVNIFIDRRPLINSYDALVLAVPHKIFAVMGIGELKQFGKKDHVFFDLKYLFTAEEVDGRL